MAVFKQTILDHFTLDGRWWEPAHPDEERDGRLAFEPEKGLKLSLFGRLPSPEKGELSLPVVHGVGDGGALTLFNAFETTHKIQFPFTKNPNASSEIWARYLVMGAHLPSLADTALENMSVSFTDLEEWHVRPNFDVKCEPPANTRTEHTPPPELKTAIPGHDFSVELDSYQGTDGDGIRTSTLTHTSVFRLVPDKPQNLLWFLERTDSIRNMLATFYGHPAYPRMAFATRAPFAGEDTATPRQLQVYFGLGIRQSPKPNHSIYMTVTARDLDAVLSTVIQNWFSKQSHLRFLHEMLQDVKHNPRFPYDFRFLAFAQGIESYHRQRYGTTYVNQEEYENQILPKLKKSLPTDIDESLRQAIATSLNYSNELSLRRRLKGLMGDLPESLRKLVSKDVAAWADAITTTRNYFTHRDPKSKPVALQGDALHDGLFSMELLMTILLLREIGMPDAGIEKRMRESFRFSKWIKNQGV